MKNKQNLTQNRDFLMICQMTRYTQQPISRICYLFRCLSEHSQIITKVEDYSYFPTIPIDTLQGSGLIAKCCISWYWPFQKRHFDLTELPISCRMSCFLIIYFWLWTFGVYQKSFSVRWHISLDVTRNFLPKINLDF